MLNREKGAAPLYSQIADILKKQIRNGEFVSGDSFYTEKKLQEMFQVSRITVRQAVSELEAEGYVQSFRGVGTTVTYGKINENLKSLVSFTEEMRFHGKEMTTTYCDMSLTKADKTIAAQLEIPVGEECYRLVRVRNVDKEPIVYSITYLKNTRRYPLLYDVSVPVSGDRVPYEGGERNRYPGGRAGRQRDQQISFRAGGISDFSENQENV